MVFVNCDISMLHYPFYREANTIIAGFNYRFWQICKLNLIFACSLFLTIMVLGRFAFSMETILLTALLLISLTAFFSSTTFLSTISSSLLPRIWTSAIPSISFSVGLSTGWPTSIASWV